MPGILKKNGDLIGLDIGSYSVKAVRLARKGASYDVCGMETLDTHGEGILNEGELYQTVAQWLAEHGLGRMPVTAGIPQFMATTIIRNFNSAGNAGALDAMVSSEIAQVMGLSDEAILEGHCSLRPACGYENPVLIAICRETSVREIFAKFGAARISLGGLSVSGIALADAFMALNPSTCSDGRVRLLLDLGYENSTAVILCDGHPLYVGSLMFSGQRFEQALKSDERPGALKASNLAEINLADEIGHSPILMAARLLENEIHGAVETWRAQESTKLSDAIVNEVYICGGVSQMRGLDAWLSERLETPVTLFGPEWKGERRPEMTLAYGLAVQSSNISALPLNIMPADVRESRKRESGLKYLAVALGVAVACVAGLDALWYCRMKGRIAEYRDRLIGLNACNELITNITSSHNELYMREARMLPLVEAGRQGEHLKEGISALEHACTDEDWVIYFADEKSYNPVDKNNARENKPHSDMFSGRDDLGDVAGQDEFPMKIQVRDMDVTGAYVAVFFSPLQVNQPYAPAKEIGRKLEESGLYSGVDFMTERARAGRSDISRLWTQRLSKSRGQFKSFAFMLPLKEMDINKQVLPVPKKNDMSRRGK